LELETHTTPLVTIVTPLYNAEKYIGETIESVINQTYKNWEMLIVDDYSTDDSRDIVNQYKDSRIQLIESKSNFGGPARPRNIGIENSQGEYIAFLDADDVWLPQKLEKQVNFLLDSPNIDIVHTLAYTIDEDSKKIGLFNNQKTVKKLKYFMKKKYILTISNYININTSLMRCNFNTRFREDKYLVALEDWCFWIDNVFYGKKEFLIEEELINYRVDVNSISNRKNDVSYKKIFYLYAVLFNENMISLTRFVLNTNIGIIKIILKRVKILFIK
jgi:teichuronic acid biosynthesis glycosyltransferase TuaG